MKITYRQATSEDLESLADLMKAFYRTEKVPFSRKQSLRALSDLLSRPAAGSLVIVEIDSKIVGYYCLTFGFSLESHGDICLIDEIYIIPSFRNRGVGSKTIKSIALAQKKTGQKALHLTVNKQNTEAIAFYRRNGFTSTKAFLMIKWLPSISQK